VPRGRHRPPRDPTPGLWLLLTLVMAGAALLWVNRGELLDLLGLAEAPPLEQAPERGRLVLHVGGRVVADPDRVPDVGDPHGPAWEGLRSALRGDNLTVVDLGCAVAPAETDGARCDPAAIRALGAAGVDAATLANEGAAALGPGALDQTLDALEEAGLGAIGAGADLEAAWRPLLVEEAGWRVAILAASEVSPIEHAADDERPGVADGRDLDGLSERVGRARGEADVVVLILHWDMPPDGPHDEHVGRAEELIDAGVDVLVGHGSGVLRRMDRVRGRSVFWSLDSLLRPVREGREVHTALARIVISSDGAVRGRLIPVAIQPPGRAVLRGL
jgi:hypothetical protein